MTDLVFAVDGGASKTRARLVAADGVVLAEALEGPCNLYQDATAGLAAIRAAWVSCCVQARLSPVRAARRTTISAGLAGMSRLDAPALFQAAFFEFGARALSSDGYAALVGAFGAAPGAVIAVGTGVVGCRFDAAGGFRQLGGWGFPVGDQGGGAWIGLRLVSAWILHRDGVVRRPEDERLWRRLAAELGDTRADILAALRQAPPARFAALAPLVLDSDTRFAKELLDAAAGAIARLAHALEASEVVLGGGLAVALAPRVARQGIRIDPDRTPDPRRGALAIAQGLRPAEFPETIPPGHHLPTTG